MRYIYDLIKNTPGLLAYWPLEDTTDHSGNGRPLTVDGGVLFGQPPLAEGLGPSIITPQGAATLKVATSSWPKIRAVEGRFRIAGPKAVQNSVVFGFSPLSTNINRCMLFYHESIGLSFWQDISPPNGGTKYRSITNNWDNLSFGCHHFVIQLNAAGTGTDVYIDGVKDAGLGVPLDIFLQPAGQQLFIGAYGNKGVPDSGNCQTSDTAVYSRPLTEDEIAYRQFVRGLPIFTRIAMTAVAANQEPRSQFQPQDVAWRGTPPMYAGPVNLQQQTQYPICKGRDYYWIRDGVRNVEQGYIESTVTISGVGVRRRVLCFTQDGELVGETYSRAADGVYRFDLLWLNKRYMLVAQDDPAFGPADYNAVAADYQAPKPYPPGGGVALGAFPMLAPLKRK